MYNVEINGQTVNYVKLWWEKTLNDKATFEVGTDGATSNTKTNLSIGNIVKIYRNGTQVLEGEVKNRKLMTGGGILVRGIGTELDLMDENSDTGGDLKKTYTSDDNTIFQDLISSVTDWSSDVSNSSAVSVSSFRVTNQMSVWNAIQRLRKTTGKDIKIDRINKTIYLMDNKGGSNQFEFVEGKNIGEPSQKEERAKASKVIVYGKGDGDSQVRSSAGSGKPVKVVTDTDIVSDSEANTRANKILNKIQNNKFYYKFRVTDPGIQLETGDGGGLTAQSLGLNSTTIDVVRKKRSIDGNGNEKLDVEVTNPAYRKASKNLQENIASQEAKTDQDNTAMQGTTNVLTFSALDNGNDTYPLRVGVSVPQDLVEDEAGNLRDLSFTVDYDIDPFRQNSKGDMSNSEQGTSEQGYSSTGNDESMTVDDSWHTVDTGVDLTVGANTYLFHGIFTHGLIIAEEQSTATGWFPDFRVRAINIDTGECIPDSIGIKVLYYMEAPDSSNEVVSPSMYIHIPRDWQGDIYALQYRIYGGGYLQTHHINYSYHGSEGHTHNNSVTIGDYVSDSDSINATSVDLHLDYHDPDDPDANANDWVEDKNTILDTTKTIDRDVDISDGGTYPDASGLWRVRVFTDSDSSDLIKSKAKLKHQMDN